MSEPDPEKDLFVPLDLPSSEAKGLVVAEKSAAIEVFDPLKRYLLEVRQFPLLTREEERALAQKWMAEKDRSAALRLVVSNLRLVVKIAFEYQRAYSNLLDLIQEGNLGLMQAVKKFDPYREVKLSSYASWWIRAYILKFLIDNWSLVKIGTTQAQRKLFFRLKKEKGRLEAMGFDPGPKLLAGALNVTKEQVTEMDQRLEGGDLSLNAPLEENGHQTYMDVLPAGDTPEETVVGTQFNEILGKKVEEFSLRLKPKEAFLLKNRLMADEPMTLQEAGTQLKVSRERARQIEKRVADKLRVFLQGQFPDLEDIQVRFKKLVQEKKQP
jgi:RNA polymerase sigma-32 factor